MLKTIISKIIGSGYDRYLKQIEPEIDKVRVLEKPFKALSDEELYAMTDKFKDRLNSGESLNKLLPEAFATVRETASRVLNMRHYDVQIIGGFVLHNGKIAEMKTGEGKTLVATLALYLNALEGKGAHLVTVNDYLAKRDATWMAPIYLTLGLSVGVIQSDLSKRVIWLNKEEGTVTTEDVTRVEAYACDITYGTNNEYGFDYLRDNMKYGTSEFVQRELSFAIVDEVDSILIDESRTPLIISGPTDDSTDKYYNINNVVKDLKKIDHYTVDEKARSATLNDDGINYVEDKLKVGNIFDITNVDTLHYVNNALKAHAIYKLDVDYVVQQNEVIIVDEFTGRLMSGRRFSDGLHQALEAKEGVVIQNENQTLASITFQNYFRMYEKLAGMTGTALTEDEEFQQIYNLIVIPIPTHQPVARSDRPDLIYRTAEFKYIAIAKEIARLYEKKQPVLVGTISIEQSELLSALLKKHKVPHEVLNAKNHEREAIIIENAGLLAAVTIATNMAGRGTDIKLGKGVSDLGGLYILGTERHESRRIDNQLRGRSGRQGDHGESCFFLSLEDDLLRIFGSDKISGIIDRLGMEDDEAIESAILTKIIENSQKKVEAMHFETRKHLLEYDNVANQQRQVIYGLRKDVLFDDNIDELLEEFTTDGVTNVLYSSFLENEQNKDKLLEDISKIYGEKPPQELFTATDVDSLRAELVTFCKQRVLARKEELAEHFTGLSKFILINIIDNRWKEHLLQMDYLRDSVGLRGYGQKDPLVEYKKESYDIFTEMYDRIQNEAVTVFMQVQIQENQSVNLQSRKSSRTTEERKDIFGRGDGSGTEKQKPVRRSYPKVGRNDLCPCGSGKKYKYCHGNN